MWELELIRQLLKDEGGGDPWNGIAVFGAVVVALLIMLLLHLRPRK